MTTPETFQRGALVEVRMNADGPWQQRIFICDLKRDENSYLCVYEMDEGLFKREDYFTFNEWHLIRKITQPKKTLLKAPAILKLNKIHCFTNNLYNSEHLAKRGCGSEFVSWPATIRLPDGSDAPLWFVCEE